MASREQAQELNLEKQDHLRLLEEAGIQHPTSSTPRMRGAELQGKDRHKEPDRTPRDNQEEPDRQEEPHRHEELDHHLPESQEEDAILMIVSTCIMVPGRSASIFLLSPKLTRKYSRKCSKP